MRPILERPPGSRQDPSAAGRFRPSPARAGHVNAALAYLESASPRPYTYMFEPPDGGPRENCGFDVRQTRIDDARSLAAPASVHTEGFALWDAPSAVSDFHDEAAVKRVYYAEAAELALAATGATRAYVFDHLLRQREAGRPPLTIGRHGDGSKPAANGRIHCDYTEASGRKRLGLVLGDAAAEGAMGRYGIVNVWRSIRGPVLDTPLAVCDARTLAAGDLVESEIRYQTRTGEIYLVQHAPRHRWFYYPEMDRHEALVFKQYDSQVSGVARFTPHAAFDLPAVPPDAPLRASIELRCLVVY